jgi:hypothetical protein
MVGLWLRAFLVTLAVETAVAPALLGRDSPMGRRLAAVLLANFVSHPFAWFVLPETGLRGVLLLALVELWAISSEVLVYRFGFPHLSWLRAAGISALANGASLGVGAIVRATTDWL